MKHFRLRNLSLKYKINFVHSLAFVLIFAAGGMIIYSFQKDAAEADIEDGLKNTTSALLNMVNTSAKMSVKNYLRAVAEKNRDIVQNLYSQYQHGKITEDEAKSKAGEIMLSQAIGKTGYIFVWNILKAPGTVILDVHPKIQGQDVAYVGFVQEGVKLKNGYMEYEWKNPDETIPRKKAMYLAFFEPWQWVIAVSSYREEFADMVDVSDFRENIISHRFEKTGYAFVINYEGVALIHPYKQIEGRSFLDEKDAGGRRFIAEMCMIQQSLLANLDVVKSYLPNSFFIWEPRDIVGGDIFYTESFEDCFIVAVIDCTGHGVPGAFMTMIAVSALKRIVKDENCHDPAEILKRLNFTVKTTLQQDKEYAVSDDGMDVGIARVQSSDLTFAGAKISMYYIYKDEVHIIKGDKQSIGYKRSDVNFDFTNHTVHIEKGMCFYMATDGFTDQLGGEKEIPFGKKRFENLLKEINKKPFEKQRSILVKAFEEHRGANERQDDVTVVGF